MGIKTTALLIQTTNLNTVILLDGMVIYSVDGLSQSFHIQLFRKLLASQVVVHIRQGERLQLEQIERTKVTINTLVLVYN